MQIKYLLHLIISIQNYDICGGWIAKSPLTRAKQERQDLKDSLRKHY